MTETERLTPALTGEQWEIFRDDRDIDGAMERLAHSCALTEPLAGNDGFYAWRSRADHMHALAALALDQLPDADPRKLTREDLVRMDQPYTVIQRYRLGAEVSDDEARAAQDTLLAFATKLRALLPPRRAAAG